ncbi:Qat anti-phage system TatD family nuclease QatD [Bradyrhizobium sp. JR3.5]
MKVLPQSIEGYDFHCHVDLDKDPRATIARCDAERVFTLAVTTTPKAFSTNVEWTRTSSYVFPAVGLHPELVGERFNELPLVLSLLSETAFIGEVGLDGSPKYKRSYENQKTAFCKILDGAQQLGGKVVTVHSRRAANDVVELIEKHTTPDRVLCILHWYAGSATAMRRAAAAGCYFSVNANMLDSDRSASLIGAMPSERILTETDAPFGLTDTRPSMPWDVLQTAGRLTSYGPGGDIPLHENAKHVLRFAGVV